MQNGKMTTQLISHDRLCFVPTSNILIPPSKSVKRAVDSLGARSADSGGGLTMDDQVGKALQLLVLRAVRSGTETEHFSKAEEKIDRFGPFCRGSQALLPPC